MKTVWKFVAKPGDNTIDVPAGAEILDAQMQKKDLCIWAMVNPKKPTVRRTVQIFGTGWELPNKLGEYAGTVQIAGGARIFHVFVL